MEILPLFNKAAGVTPAGWSSNWTHLASNRATIAWGTSPDSPSITRTTINVNTAVGSEPQYHGVFQLVGPPLAAQTLPAGTLSGQWMANENNVNIDGFLSVHARVIKSDGTDRGILVGLATSAYEFSTGASNRRFLNGGASVALSSLEVQDNDRIVIEVGNEESYSYATGIIVWRYGGLFQRYGGLPEDNSSTDLNKVEWFSLSYEPKFYNNSLDLSQSVRQSIVSDNRVDLSQVVRLVIAEEGSTSYQGELDVVLSSIEVGLFGEVVVEGVLGAVLESLGVVFEAEHALSGRLESVLGEIQTEFGGDVIVQTSQETILSPILVGFLAKFDRALIQETFLSSLGVLFEGNVQIRGGLNVVLAGVEADLGFDINVFVQGSLEVVLENLGIVFNGSSPATLFQDTKLGLIETGFFGSTVGTVRTVQIRWEPRACIGLVSVAPAKDPNETVCIQVDFGAGVAPGDRVDKVIFVGCEDPFMLGLRRISGNCLYQIVSGGFSGQVYKFKFTVELHSKLRLTAVGFLPVREF